MTRRPKIRIFMTNQHNGTFFLDGPADWLHVPNLARLAARSTRVADTDTASPLWAPERASVMSGRLPSRCRVCDDAAEFSAEIPTHAHHLRHKRSAITRGGTSRCKRRRSAARAAKRISKWSRQTSVSREVSDGFIFPKILETLRSNERHR